MTPVVSSRSSRPAGAALARLAALAVCVVVAMVATACGPAKERAPADGASAGAVADKPAPDACLGEGATLSGEGVGALRIGATVQSLGERCRIVRDTTLLDIEGQPQRTLAVLAGDDTLSVEVVDDRVWRLQVTTRRPRTADSLGVGTPLSRLLTLPEVHGLRGEGTLFVVSAQHCGLSFQLSESGMRENVREWTPEALRRLSPSTVVARVLAIGCTPPAQPVPPPVSGARPRPQPRAGGVETIPARRMENKCGDMKLPREFMPPRCANGCLNRLVSATSACIDWSERQSSLADETDTRPAGEASWIDHGTTALPRCDPSDKLPAPEFECEARNALIVHQDDGVGSNDA